MSCRGRRAYLTRKALGRVSRCREIHARAGLHPHFGMECATGAARMANAKSDQEALRHRLGGMEKIIEKLAA